MRAQHRYPRLEIASIGVPGQRLGCGQSPRPVGAQLGAHIVKTDGGVGIRDEGVDADVSVVVVDRPKFLSLCGAEALFGQDSGNAEAIEQVLRTGRDERSRICSVRDRTLCKVGRTGLAGDEPGHSLVSCELLKLHKR